MRSHIVPEFLHGPLYDAKHRAHLVDFLGSSRLLQKGLRESLLCQERKSLIQPAEDYFARYWYKRHPIPDRLAARELMLTGIDYRLFKLFLLSIIWRASVELLFAQLRASRYRFMAAFGANASKPCDELDGAIREILVAARMLGTYDWPRQGRVAMPEDEFKRHLEEMHRHEAAFWSVGDDQIAERVHAAVSEVEAIVSRSVTPRRRHWYGPRTWVTRRGS